MEFEWGPKKRAETIAERRIDFVDMIPAFADPNRMVVEDRRNNYGEVRFNTIARCDGLLYHITYTMRGEAIRIISARRANRKETRHYDGS